jgi:hypothetical protein
MRAGLLIALIVSAAAAPSFAAVMDANHDALSIAEQSRGSAIQAKLRSGAQDTRALAAQELSLRQAWSGTQKRLETQATEMMDTLRQSDSFAAQTRARVHAAKAEEQDLHLSADRLDHQRTQLIAMRQLLQKQRVLLSARLDALAGNLTALATTHEHAKTEEQGRVDEVSQLESQLAKTETEDAKERAELYNLDVRLHSLADSVLKVASAGEGAK